VVARHDATGGNPAAWVSMTSFTQVRSSFVRLFRRRGRSSTSLGLKIGRLCRLSGPGSCSSRPGSSTGTRRLTWRPARPGTA